MKRIKYVVCWMLAIIMMMPPISGGSVRAEEDNEIWYVDEGSSNAATFRGIVMDSRVFDQWKYVHNVILSPQRSDKSYRNNELNLLYNFDLLAGAGIDINGDVNYTQFSNNLQYASSPRIALYEAMRTYQQEGTIGPRGIFTDTQMDKFLNMWVNDDDITTAEGDTYWVGVESQHYTYDIITGALTSTPTSRNMVKDVIMFYDFKVNEVTNLIAAPPVIKNGDNIHTSTFKAINPNYETIEVAKEFSYTTSREITDVQSVSIENGLSNTFEAGLEIEFPQVGTGSVSTSFTYTFNRTDEWSHGVTKLNEETVTDSLSIPLPPHTTITIDEATGVTEVSRTYSAGSKLSYKVAMIRLYGVTDAFINVASLGGSYSKTQVYPLAVFGGDNGDAVEDLKKRAIDNYTGNDRDDLLLSNSFDNLFLQQPYTLDDGEFIYKERVSTITPNQILPMYNLDQIIPNITNIDMFEDELYKLNNISLSALNRFGVDYYGFSQYQDGTWAIVDKEGNIDNTVAVIADGLNDKVIKPLKSGLTYLKYIPDYDEILNVEGVNDYSVRSHLIPITVQPTNITELTVNGEISDIYFNDGSNQVDLSTLSVVALDEFGSEKELSDIKWCVDESEGLTIGQDTIAKVTSSGIYHIYAQYNDKESNRITLTVYPERRLDSMNVLGNISDLVWNDPSLNTVDLSTELLIEAKDQYGDDYIVDSLSYQWLVGSANSTNVKSTVNGNTLTGEVVGMDTITLKVNDLYSTPIVFNIKASPYMNELIYAGEAPEVRPGVAYDLSEISLIARDQYGSTMILGDAEISDIQWEVQEAGNLTAIIDNGQLKIGDDLEDGEITQVVLSATLAGQVKTCRVEDIQLKVREAPELRQLDITAPEGLELKLNENANLSNFGVIGYDQYGDVYEVLREDIQWISSESDVIEVIDKATIIGKKIDKKVILTAQAGNIVSNEIELMVYGVREFSHLAIIGAPESIYTDRSIDLSTLSLRIQDQYGKVTAIEAIPGEIVWSLEQEATESEITDSTLVVGSKNGDLILKAQVKNTVTGELIQNLLGKSTIRVDTYVAPPGPTPTPGPTPSPVNIEEIDLGDDEKIPEAGLFGNLNGFYEDIPDDHWAYDAIHNLSNLGFIEGKEPFIFKPNDEITRAELTAFTVNILGSFDNEALEPFDDVRESDKYHQHIASAYSSELIKGYSEAAFGPKDSIKRQDVVVIIMRALEVIEELQKSNFDASTFIDKNEISVYARDYVVSSVKYKIIEGFDTIEGRAFGPHRQMTRAEAVMMLYRFYQLYIEILE